MKKIVIIGLIIIFIASVLVVIMIYPNTKKQGTVNFELYGSYTVDSREMRRLLGLKVEAPFTFFRQFTSFEYLKAFFKEYHADVPDFGLTSENYKDKYLAVTFGRELVDLKYKHTKYDISAIGVITFAEICQDNIIYLYLTDEIGIANMVYLPSELYIMNGSERVYYGTSYGDVNESRGTCP